MKKSVLPWNSMHFLRASIFLFAVLFCGTAMAQTVTGVVTDAETNEPLIGVTVLEKGTSNGAATDIDGSYSVTLTNSNAVLVFSFVGFATQEIAYTGQSAIDVALQSGEQLEEVVVTALGIKKEVKKLGYSVESVAGDAIAQSSDDNVLNALQGKVAGLQIAEGDGVAGGTTRITLRGNNSLVEGKNQPLIVVDGVPIENNIAGAGAASQLGETNGKDWGSGINNINSWDIADVSVLKGPSAAALYGSRGANGVILITTKKGQKREGIGIDFNTTQTITSPYRYRDVQNEFGEGSPRFGYPELTQNDQGQYVLPSVGFWGSGVSWGPRMDGTPVLWWNGEVLPFEPQPDNIKSFFHDQHTQDYNLAFSGGSDLGSMRASLSRRSNDAIVPNVTRNQTTVALNASLNVTSRLRADFAVNYFDSEAKNSPTLGSSEAAIGKNLSYNWGRSYRPELESCCYENPDGTLGTAGIAYPRNDALGRGRGRTGRFFWNVYNNNEWRRRDRVIASTVLNFQITDWLTAEGRLGIDNYNDDDEARNKPIDSEGLQAGRYWHTLKKNRIQNHSFLLNANKQLTDDIQLSANLGAEYWNRQFYSISGRNANRNFLDPYLYSFANADISAWAQNGTAVFNNARASEGKLEKEIQSVFGSVDLSYKNFLYLTLTGRNDWSSTLPVDNNNYFYPSVAVGFVFTDAFNIAGNSPLTFGKVRFSVAKVANDTNPYQLTPTFSRGNFAGQPSANVRSTIPPITLAPEQQNSWEAGLDLRFFNGRLNFDFTYYYIRSYNQILAAPIPITSGFSSLRFNTGELENKGIEILLSATPVKTNNFSWDFGVNLNHNNNYVVSLSEGAQFLQLGNVFGGNGPSVDVAPGEKFGTIRGWDFTYYDKNGNGITDKNERVPENRIINENGRSFVYTSEKVPLGNATPDFIGGITNSLSYKNFQLNSLIDMKIGGDLFWYSYSVGRVFGQSPATLPCREGGCETYTNDDGESFDNGVIQPGVYADGTPNDKVVPYFYPHLSFWSWGPQNAGMSQVVGEASWLRLKELSLTYTLPATMTQKLGFIQNASITLIGRNVGFLWDTGKDWDNLDPSAVAGSGIGASAFENGSLPSTRTFGFQLRTSF